MTNLKALALAEIMKFMIDCPDKGLYVRFDSSSYLSVSDDKDARDAYLEFFTYHYDVRKTGAHAAQTKYFEEAELTGNLQDLYLGIEISWPIFVVRRVGTGEVLFTLFTSRIPDERVEIHHNYFQLGKLVISRVNSVNISEINQADKVIAEQRKNHK